MRENSSLANRTRLRMVVGLGIALLPPGLEQLDESERNDGYRDAAAGLGAMLRLKDTQPDQAKQGIIMQALRVLAESGNAANVGVNNLVEFIASEEAAVRARPP